MDEALKVYADQNSWPKRFRGPLDRAVEDCRWFAHLASQLQLGERWRQLAETWEDFCQDKLGYSSEFVEAVIAGVRALGEVAPIPIQRAADEGRRVKAAQLKQEEEQATLLVEEQGMSLRQAAKVMGRDHKTVANRLGNKSLSNEKFPIKTASQRVDARQVYLPMSPQTAAQKIKEKFGEDFAKALKEAL